MHTMCILGLQMSVCYKFPINLYSSDFIWGCQYLSQQFCGKDLNAKQRISQYHLEHLKYFECNYISVCESVAEADLHFVSAIYGSCTSCLLNALVAN